MISVSPRIPRGASLPSSQLVTRDTHRPPPACTAPVTPRCRSLRPRDAAPSAAPRPRPSGLAVPAPCCAAAPFRAAAPAPPRPAIAPATSRRPLGASPSHPALYHAHPQTSPFSRIVCASPITPSPARPPPSLPVPQRHHPRPSRNSTIHARPATPPSTPVPQHPGPRPRACHVRNSTSAPARPFATPTSAPTPQGPRTRPAPTPQGPRTRPAPARRPRARTPRARSPTRWQAMPIIGACGDVRSAHPDAPVPRVHLRDR